MSPYREPAPRGFRWADSPVGRSIVTVLAVVSLALSLYVGYRYVELIDCLQSHAAADAVRTRAIAEATDLERMADRDLLEGPDGPSAKGRTGAQLRRDALDARAHTDRVRAANPAPDGVSASCR